MSAQPAAAGPATGDAPQAAAGARGALGHLRVLDLSRVLAGPWCGQILADLGAEVIKVERPGEGDDTRHWGPPFLHDSQGQPTEQATYYSCANRNKRSLTVDLAHAEGQAVVRELALRSDVLIENFKVGGLARYGLDYPTLKALNPRLIYCSITGFGQTGPYAQRAGYDLLVQAACGLMSITGRPDEAPGGGPMRVGVAVTDLFTGVYACTAILAAVEARHHSGQGQHIDMALMDVGMAMLANQAAAWLNTGSVPQRQGNSHPSIVPYQDFPTRDGNMLLAVGNDGQFARFCAAAGVPQWAADARFATNTQRVAHREELVAMVAEITRTRSTAEWVALLEDRAVPCGPINDIGEAFADAQVQARGLRVDLPHPRFGTVGTVASPLRLSDTPPQMRHAPPILGEHTDQVLQEVLGYDPARIAALREQGVI
ncbi:CaiB/BaiF CoA transferase family protein [Eleftheria terrae]|uniref:CaiB/BaiF CoA transferase family protein n=1 Tax=Eleftheria terrae TaxID=1597781 RepID=UPI00263AEAA9|nr:CaiB/BaiF CoA-transferase family protein [Eleftheria terrae]WKB54532.1 CoA transferase [Eleftheria terrae]